MANVDENTRMVGRIKSAAHAKRKLGRSPRIGYEYLVDTGTVKMPPRFKFEIGDQNKEYKTWLVNAGGRLRVWTWISV